MSETDNKDKKDEGVVTLTKAEVADIRKMMGTLVEKDRQIEDLTGVVAELRKSVANIGSLPIEGEDEESSVVQGQFARMRVTEDGKWVLGWTPRNAYRERNQLNEIVEYIDIIVEGEKAPRKMQLLDFMNNCNQRTVRIREKRKLRDDIKDEGIVEHSTFNEATGEFIASGRKVRSRVISPVFEFDLELGTKEDGTPRVVTVLEKYVNQ